MSADPRADPLSGSPGQVSRAPRWAAPPPRSSKQVAVALLLGAVLFFVLPYYLPVHRVLSDSYGFGYSNRGAVVLLLLFALGFAQWIGPLRADREAPVAEASSRRALGVVLLTGVLLRGVMWFIQHRYGPIQEGVYFYDRLEHVASGRRVYRDFEFAYGALLLYLPLWLAKIPGLSLVSGYSFSLLVEEICGLLMFWYVLRRAAEKCVHWQAIFFFIAGTMLAWAPLAGAQYTALRYWIAPAALVLSYRLAFHRHSRPMAGLVLLGGVCGALLVAPEQTAGLMGGVWLFSLLFLRRAWRWLLPALAVLTAISGALLLVCYRARVLETVLTIGSGAYAVPVAPSLPVLLALALLLAAACAGVEMFRQRSSDNVQLLLLCMCPFYLAAAFGRCDPEHALSNTFTAAVVGWLAIAGTEWRWRRFAWAYAVIIFIFPTQLPFAYMGDLLLVLHGQQNRVIDVRHDPRPSVLAFNGLYGSMPGADVLPYRVDTGRFFGTTDLISEAQVREKLSEVDAGSPFLATSLSCGGVNGRRSMYLYTGGFFFPKARNHVDLGTACTDFLKRVEVVDRPGFPLLPGVHAYRLSGP